MAETTNIGWCDSTMNFWIGCTEVSPACAPCYAREWAARRYPAAKWGDYPRIRTSEALWKAPLGWDRKAAQAGTRPFVFTNSLADIFDNQVDPQWRRDAFDLMRATPHLVWLLLTKRPGNIVDQSAEAGGLPPNAAIGCTVVTQDEVTRDVRKLTTAKAASSPLFAFLSIEPMLTEIDLYRGGFSYLSRLTSPQGKKYEKVDWVICGGMSGDTWRDHEVPVEWVRALREQCGAEGTPFYFKQWSARYAKQRGCELDGREHKERPHVEPLPRPPGPPAAPPRPTQPELFAA